MSVESNFKVIGRDASSWGAASRLIYVSGASTGPPKEIVYSFGKYVESVETTAMVLSAHGVAGNERVAILQPFDPWAIGPIFRDAALLCGATVLPLGLNGYKEAFLDVLRSFKPSFLCGSASLISSLNFFCNKDNSLLGIFHAGEPLRESGYRRMLQMSRRVVDIYGMAEFDTIAATGVTNNSLILSPNFDYMLLTHAGEQLQIAEGLTGELLIRRPEDFGWCETGDQVRIESKSDATEALWPLQWTIRHLGRNDARIKLPDGSNISSGQLQMLSQRVPAIETLQLQISSLNRTQLRLLVSFRSGDANGFFSIRKEFLNICCELADAIAHGVISLHIVEVSQLDFFRSERGKVLPLVEI
jgi:phenylacetate-coenzyme A ligase PaaK-like adenylate-forming protein